MVDPLSQFSSPYNFTGNNPVNFIDPDGMYSYNWNTGKYATDKGKEVSFDEVSSNNFIESEPPKDWILDKDNQRSVVKNI